MFKNLLLATLLLFSAGGQDRTRAQDERLQRRMGTLHGTVTLLNHPELGKTPGAAAYILFQRADCKKAVVGVTTDASGTYRISLSTGRYRLFSRYGTKEGETTDWLVPSQPRFVEVKPDEYREFNVELRFPE